jgi:hypothetical protein
MSASTPYFTVRVSLMSWASAGPTAMRDPISGVASHRLAITSRI